MRTAYTLLHGTPCAREDEDGQSDGPSFMRNRPLADGAVAVHSYGRGARRSQRFLGCAIQMRALLDRAGTTCHQHYGHPSKPGVVTVPGKLGKGLPIGTERSILGQAGIDRRPR